MSQIPGFKCDICQVEVRSISNWEYNGNGGTFTVRGPDGINGKIYRWNNLCRPCRTALCAAIAKVIEERKPDVRARESSRDMGQNEHQ